MFLYSDVFSNLMTQPALSPKTLFKGNSSSAEDLWAPAGLQMFVYSDILLFRWVKHPSHVLVIGNPAAGPQMFYDSDAFLIR